MNLTLPQSWKQITLGQFVQVTETMKLTFENEYERELHLLSILSGEKYETLTKKLTLTEITRAAKQLDFLKEMPEAGAPQMTFRLKGVKYVFRQNIKKITGGDFIDLDNYLKNGLNNMHLILALFTREGTKEPIEQFESRAQIFWNHLPITTAYPLALFFSNLLTHWLPLIEISLAKEIRKKNLELLKDLRQNMTDGDGTEYSNESAKAM